METRTSVRGSRFCKLLLRGITQPPSLGPVLLDDLCRRYMREAQPYLDNKLRSRAYTGYRTPVLLAYFGAGRDVRSLSAADIAAYSTARRAGGIQLDGERRTRAVRQRSVHADLVLLRTMLRWACRCV